MPDPDVLIFLQQHPRFGHVEIVVDSVTPRGRKAFDHADRTISSHIAETLEDIKRAGLTALFLPH